MMNREKFFKTLQIIVICGIAAFVIYVVSQHLRRRTPSANLYVSVREAVQDRIDPRKIYRFVAPGELEIKPIDDERVEARGWLQSTNSSGIILTQWFKCVLITHSKSPVADIRFFRDPPIATNALSR
jgi:hypothetical protein